MVASSEHNDPVSSAASQVATAIVVAAIVFVVALFFACMHFSLLVVGVDTVTMIVVFVFAFSLGLLAGHVRAKTGSLIPAILAHILANPGGMIGGVVYRIATL